MTAAAIHGFFEPLAAAVEFPDWLMYGTADVAWKIFSPAVLPFESALVAALPDQVAAVRSYFETERYATKMPLPLSDPVLALFALLCYPVGMAILYGFSKIVGKLKCREIGLVHNFFLFSLSLYMWAAILLTALSMFDRIWDIGVHNETANDWRLAKLLWVFYISKLPEFGDTFLMVLKQNYHQISFLHLYHHTTIFAFWYYICIAAPGGDCYFSAMLNSGIHVIMYGYYFFTMLFATGHIRRFFESIKFMITKGQMAQFMLNCCQATYICFFVDTEFHVQLARALFIYMCTLLALFGNFLVKGQAKAKAAKKSAKADAPVLPAASARTSAVLPAAGSTVSARPSAAVARASAAAPVLAEPTPAKGRASSSKRKSVRKED